MVDANDKSLNIPEYNTVISDELQVQPISRFHFINRINNFLDKFLYSGTYVFLLALLVFVCWHMSWEVAGIAIFVIISSLILILRCDITPLLPIVFLVAMIFPKDIEPLSYSNAFYFFIPLPISLIYHICRFKVKFRIGKMFFPQLAITVALLMGGVGSISSERYLAGLAFVLMLGFLLLIIYFFLYLYFYPPKSLDLKKYLSLILVAVGLVICAEVAVYYASTPYDRKLIGSSVSIGWAIANNFSTILLFSVPAALYLSTRAKFALPYVLLAAAEYIVIIVGWSRGATLFAAIMFPFLLAATIVKSKENRKQVIVSLGIIFGILLIVFAILSDEIIDMFKGILAQGTGASGRDLLYAEAIKCFKANPVFGAGIGFKGDFYVINNMPMYWFHSTFLQIIGSMGLVGLLAYSYSYYARYRILVRKNDAFSLFLIIGMIGFEGYSMMDTGTFIPIPIMLQILLITMVMEFINKDHPETFIDYKPFFGKIKACFVRKNKNPQI